MGMIGYYFAIDDKLIQQVSACEIKFAGFGPKRLFLTGY